MLAVAREFLSLRPTSPESVFTWCPFTPCCASLRCVHCSSGTSASPTSTSRRSHLASVTDSLLGMMIPGGLPVGPEAAAGAGNDTEEVVSTAGLSHSLSHPSRFRAVLQSPSDPAPVAASGTSRAPLGMCVHFHLMQGLAHPPSSLQHPRNSRSALFASPLTCQLCTRLVVMLVCGLCRTYAGKPVCCSVFALSQCAKLVG